MKMKLTLGLNCSPLKGVLELNEVAGSFSFIDVSLKRFVYFFRDALMSLYRCSRYIFSVLQCKGTIQDLFDYEFRVYSLNVLEEFDF